MAKSNPKKEKNNRKKIKNSLEYSVIDGVAYSGMAGFGQSYISPLAIALKASSTQIGFLSSFPQLIRALFQLHAVKVTEKTKARKRIVLISALIQAILWLPLFLIPYILQEYNVAGLIALACVYFVIDGFGAPAWISWIGDLVPENRRGEYFGFRNRVMGISSFLSVLAAGFILEFFSGYNELLGFFVIFFIAFLFRVISFVYLKKMYEPRYEVKEEDVFSFVDFVKRMRKTNFGVFVIYLTLFRFGVSIASPFFVVFMLRELGFSYSMYTTLIAVSSVVTVFTVAYWGKYGDRFGNKSIFSLTGYLIPLIPLLWLVSNKFIYLAFVMAFSGFVWAGFNLTSSNFLFDAVSPRKRARCAAFYNIFIGVSNFVGAFIGGLLLKILPTPSFFVSNIQTLFLISGILRLLPAIFFLPKVKEPRETEKIKKTRLLFSIVAYEPVQKLTYQTSLGFSRIRNTVGKRHIKRSRKLIKGLLESVDDIIKLEKRLKKDKKK